MATITNPKTPANLKARGRNLWKGTVEGMEWQPYELLQLEDICRAADAIADLEAAARKASTFAKGSTGQVVIHPVIQELRVQRASFAQLVKQLNLPVDDEGSERSAAAERSASARSLAQQRWKRAS
jgi:hypothetical protein